MLIRFDDSSQRGPSASIWQGLVDWVRGSLATALGQRDFEDHMPDIGTGAETVTSTTGSPTRALQSDEEFGVVNYTEAAGTNECVTVVRHIWYDLNNSPVLAYSARAKNNADADSPQMFFGFTDQTLAFASGTLDGGSGEDSLGLRWNADETFDIVAVDAGTLTVLKDDIGITVERTTGFVKVEFKVEKINSTLYRITPAINGVVARSGRVNVALTSLPENPMRPCVATTVAANTAPDFDVDYVYSGNK